MCVISSYIYAYFACFGVHFLDMEADPIANRLILTFESIFAISMCFKFFTTYVADGTTTVVKDRGKIASRYFRTQFPYDFFVWCPFFFFSDCSKDSFYRLFFLIKVVRIKWGLKLIDVGPIMSAFQNLAHRRIKRMIEENPAIGEDQLNDHNNINRMILLGHIIRTIRLIIIIMSTSYFIGILWRIYCELIHSIQKNLHGDEYES